ncbi:hypothetical protein ABK040_000664 [Willaertia magna]
MKVFLDVFTRDELFSDSFPIRKEYEGVFYAVTSKQKKKDEDTGDLYDLDAFEKLTNKPESVTTVDEIVENFKLNELQFAKKSELTKVLSNYLGALRERITKNAPERLELFNAQAKKFIMDDVAVNFGDYKYYTGESYDIDSGMVIVQKFLQDGITTEFYFFVDGLREQKL